MTDGPRRSQRHHKAPAKLADAAPGSDTELEKQHEAPVKGKRRHGKENDDLSRKPSKNAKTMNKPISESANEQPIHESTLLDTRTSSNAGKSSRNTNHDGWVMRFAQAVDDSDSEDDEEDGDDDGRYAGGDGDGDGEYFEDGAAEGDETDGFEDRDAGGSEGDEIQNAIDETMDEDEEIEHIWLHIQLQTADTSAKKKKKKKPLDVAKITTFVPRDNLTCRTLKAAILKAIRDDGTAYIGPQDDHTIHFTIPFLLRDSTALNDVGFKLLTQKIAKKEKPEVKVVVYAEKLELAQNDDEMDEDTDAETQKSKRKWRTRAPRAADIDPANLPVLEKMELLREKLSCVDPDGSDRCYVDPETGVHIPVTNDHIVTWANAWEAGEADELTPPNHHLFDATKHRRKPSLLQQRIIQMNNSNTAASPRSISTSISRRSLSKGS
uniref:Uncharacterized protein n=1 Tax=Mycena chlorophos TaxID=658473 RepID=A0ABQ0L9E9_MYCCL|nr:predicted protein [Mycena chlorophos]